ncbi:MAG TPA: hypothetical protein VF131_08430 [Blastocatellia bacterium]|nr:hypothetical protein [Blastocatellia bacterium]
MAFNTSLIGKVACEPGGVLNNSNLFVLDEVDFYSNRWRGSLPVDSAEPAATEIESTASASVSCPLILAL